MNTIGGVSLCVGVGKQLTVHPKDASTVVEAVEAAVTLAKIYGQGVASVCMFSHWGVVTFETEANAVFVEGKINRYCGGHNWDCDTFQSGSTITIYPKDEITALQAVEDAVYLAKLHGTGTNVHWFNYGSGLGSAAAIDGTGAEVTFDTEASAVFVLGKMNSLFAPWRTGPTQVTKKKKKLAFKVPRFRGLGTR